MIVHGAVLVSAFLIVWFLALFCLFPMPLGSERDPDTGAPVNPQLRKKVLIATVIAGVTWIAFYAAIGMHVVDL
jgi:predicted secreted protein